MPRILRKPRPPTGGTPVEPSPCEILVVIATSSDPLIAHGSQDNTVHRYRKGVAGHREGIRGRISPSQVMFRWHQRLDQALRGALVLNNLPILLTIAN